MDDCDDYIPPRPPTKVGWLTILVIVLASLLAGGVAGYLAGKQDGRDEQMHEYYDT